jgi:crotonobetainyl-CoA:carnitine CoA-transferase CaiB-like acyl-CoA transferase
VDHSLEALGGVKIVEFARHMAAPFATQVLSDFGAEVIKIESIGGDPSRQSGTEFVGEDSAVFLNWNHGKRSVAVDMHREEGRRLVQDIAATADVVVENYRPGVAEEIGVGYDQLAQRNPGLIYCSLTAFGRIGPWADRPGTDPVVQALSGVMYVTGEPDGGPIRAGVPIADYTGAMTLAQAILLGLLAREHTGRGQRIDVSMLHAMIMSLSTRVASYWATGQEPGRWGSAHSVVAPYQAFQTSDGYVVAGAWAQESWPRFCTAIDRQDLVNDPRFANNPDRVRNRDEITKIVAEIMITKTTLEWEQRFAEASALFAPVLPVSEVFAHPQIQAMPASVLVEHPVHGKIPVPAPAITMHETPAAVRRAPPTLGQHTYEILGEAGYSSADIDALVESGVVRSGLPAGPSSSTRSK